MRTRGTRTLTMVFLLLTPPLLFIVAELSWFFGARAAASPGGVTAGSAVGGLSATSAAMVATLLCPALVLVLGRRLEHVGHLRLGRSISWIAPLVMVLGAVCLWLGRG